MQSVAIGLVAIWIFGVPCALTQADSVNTEQTTKALSRIYDSRSKIVGPVFVSNSLQVPADVHCASTGSGKATLLFYVDETGMPRNPIFDDPIGNDLDELAMKVVEADRFTPGTLNGKPVAAAQKVIVKLRGCVVEWRGQDKKMLQALVLHAPPEQKFFDAKAGALHIAKNLTSDSNKMTGNTAPSTRPSPPQVIFAPTAEPTPEAERNHVSAICLVSLIVDQEGMPQKVALLHDVGYGLGQKAIEAVSRYRFRPAMQDGVPVAVMIHIEVKFKVY